MALTLIKSLTASGDSELEFIDGTDDVVMDSSYSVYEFIFVDIHLATLNAELQFQVNSTNDAGGSYNASPMTTTIFGAYHNEDDGSADIDYFTGHDIANAADTFQNLTYNQKIDNDSSMSGSMTLYDPSSTTYVKHFTARTNGMGGWGASLDNFVAGYINDYQYAIDEIKFQSSSGNIDDGTIYMYGVS
tara:strand:- start:234 stop:800 length:567 start_codon:yes stop_codon:yes gene_type:complete